ncbi:MAG: hypothetical protein KU37_02785 [Sulfuricurvum sp. PC08-66]|nr:MAG: hypothetical protein KU37_02785 [Sulfuricurvum sp. PC08-66]
MAQATYGATVQIQSLMETPTSKEIRIVMDTGQSMKEHTAPQAITIMVLQGEVRISSDEGEVMLEAGDMVYFAAKVPHALEALSPSVVRLSLAKSDSVSRVLGVLK